MGGIPDAAGAPQVRYAVTRVALRLAVLTGLVVGGWLLGSATGWAQEDWGHEDPGRHGADAVSVEVPSLTPAAAVSRIEANAAPVQSAVQGLPTVQPARLPVQPPILDDVAAPIGEPTPAPVLRPVLDTVLRGTVVPRAPSQVTGDNQAESLTPAVTPGSTEPAEVLGSVEPRPPTGYLTPPEPAAWAMNAPPTPLPTVTPTITSATKWTVALGQVVDTAPVSYPAGSAGASGTGPGIHAVTLNGGCPEAAMAAGPRPKWLRTAGLPGAPDQQPSTSPD